MPGFSQLLKIAALLYNKNMNEAFGVRLVKNIEIPVRDGTKLRANLFLPSKKGKYPALLVRTPYKKVE